MAEIKADEPFHIKFLQTQREQQRKAFEESLAKLEEQKEKEIAPMEQRFAYSDEGKKAKIVGLVTLDEYKRKREGLDEEESLARSSSSGILYRGPNSQKVTDSLKNKEKTPKPKKPKVEKSKLSFDVEEEETESFQVIPKKREEKNVSKESSSETSSPKADEKKETN